MNLFYVTLNQETEAQQISHALLARQLAVCTNWFPMTCAYRWQGEIKQEPEIVLIIKTQARMRTAIEALIAEYVSYTHFIGELDVASVNQSFLNWLTLELA